jgi:hypothetical protein
MAVGTPTSVGVRVDLGVVVLSTRALVNGACSPTEGVEVLMAAEGVQALQETVERFRDQHSGDVPGPVATERTLKQALDNVDC